MSRDYLWFRFWASDALSSMGFLGASMEERGLWLTLLCMMWRNGGPLKYDPEKIARMCGCSTDVLRTLVRNLDGTLLTIEDGVIRSDRLEEERKRVDKKSQQARAAVNARRDRVPTSVSTDVPTGSLPVSSQESVVSNQEPEVSSQTDGRTTGQSDSPVTKTPDREPAVRAPVSRSVDEAIENLRSYLGEHAGVVDYLLETLPSTELSRVVYAINTRWLPQGIYVKSDFLGVAEERRPAIITTAIADYPWATKLKNGGADLRHFQGFIGKIVRGEHKASETAEGWAWTET